MCKGLNITDTESSRRREVFHLAIPSIPLTVVSLVRFCLRKYNRRRFFRFARLRILTGKLSQIAIAYVLLKHLVNSRKVLSL